MADVQLSGLRGHKHITVKNPLAGDGGEAFPEIHKYVVDVSTTTGLLGGGVGTYSVATLSSGYTTRLIGVRPMSTVTAGAASTISIVLMPGPFVLGASVTNAALAGPRSSVTAWASATNWHNSTVTSQISSLCVALEGNSLTGGQFELFIERIPTHAAKNMAISSYTSVS